MDEERRKTHQHLESAVQERTAELRQAYERLEKELAERKKAEEELEASEKRLRTVVTGAPVVLFTLDREGVFTLSEGEGLKALGLKPGEAVGLSAFDVYRDTPEIVENIRRALNGEEFNSVVPIAGLVFETWYSPTRDQNGKVTGVIGVATDITERKRAEEALKDSEENLKAYLESAPDGIYINDLKGTFLYGNTKAEEIMGYKREELIGKSFLKLKLLPAKYVVRAAKLLALNAMGRPTGPDEFELTRKDGSRIWVEIGTTPIKQKGKVVVIGIVRDITERKKAEEAVRESEERYRTLINLGSEVNEAVIMEQDTEQGEAMQIYVSDAWSRITGYSKDELLKMSYFDLLHPRCRQAIVDRHRKRMRGETVPQISDKSIVRKDGVEVPIESVSATTTYKGGKVHIAYIRDITERKRAEEKIQRSYDVQTVVNTLLHISLLDISLEEQLELVIKHILSIPWLTVEPRGAIFLVEDKPGVLVMKAQRGLAEPLMTACARLPFGKCLCGRAAVSGEIEFADRVDKRHEIQYEGIKPHGHYCVPILSAGRVIGVINLYLKEGHHRDEREEEFLRAVADVLAGLIERKRAEGMVRNIAEGVSAATGEAFFQSLAQYLTRTLKVDYALIGELVGGEEERIKTLAVSTRGEIAKNFDYSLAGTPCENVMDQSLCAYPSGVQQQFPDDHLLAEMGVKSYVGTPLFDSEGSALGLIAVMDTKPMKHLSIIESMLRIFAVRAAAELERKQAEEKVKTASLDTIYRLSRAAEYKDEETGAHIQRMSRYSVAVAGQMGLDDDEVENILYAAPMHDIGKIGIPDRILLRPGKLDPDEWDIMKQHTTIGAKILAGSDAEFIRLGEVIALTHHERWDGKGYPKGLKGSEIPLVGRIAAIADVFDALISKRPYKKAFPVQKSLAIIRENRGSHFDPEVVDAFFAISDEILAIKKEYPDLGESPLIRLANKST